ncbi:MAG: hypothetical protein BMS9Abin02_1098 [Anaerolineae bacterium]|nr:MAG: hypothetical protein BMS9Abin02_1098 [Anaerolineae bacterium]
MNSALERVIAESLEALESGRSIEEILAEHPEQAEALRPILATAANLASLKIAHSIGAQSNSLDQFLAAASAKRGAATGSRRPFWLYGRRLAVTASVILLLLLAISSSVTFAAQAAIPGDALYGAKVVIEDIRISLAGDGPSRDRLDAVFNQNRIEEIEELIASGRSASGIEFTGRIESIDGQTWVISGISITVSEDLVNGTPFDVGQGVIVTVNVTNGEVRAVGLVRSSRLDDDSEPEPVTTEQPEDVVKPDLEASPTLQTTATATDPVTETPVAIISDTPTPNGIADPEATPTLEGDDHENGDDDGDSEDEESEDNFGSSGEEEDEEDNSGSGSGSDDSDSDDDLSGSSDANDEEDEEDSSGSGSGSDDSDSDDDLSGNSDADDEEDEEDSSGSSNADDEEDDEEDKEKGGD